MSENKFAAVFTETVNAIVAEAAAIGVPMVKLCSDAGCSRANISRWRRKIPATIISIDRLQVALEAARAAKAAA